MQTLVLLVCHCSTLAHPRCISYIILYKKFQGLGFTWTSSIAGYSNDSSWLIGMDCHQHTATSPAVLGSKGVADAWSQGVARHPSRDTVCLFPGNSSKSDAGKNINGDSCILL